jgi:hypothetical protein
MLKLLQALKQIAKQNLTTAAEQCLQEAAKGGKNEGLQLAGRETMH